MSAADRGIPQADVVPLSLDEDHLVFDTYDLVTQQCASHHYRRDADGRIRYGAGHFGYIWPAECDLMAQVSGLGLESRSADWNGRPFRESPWEWCNSGPLMVPASCRSPT